jgi:tRNA A-37 threonylcarbamoyl transferase component Bud32
MTQTLFGQIGPYIIERPIGHGGMASVFLARDSRSSAQVALKVVHLGSDQEAREILESEQRGAELQRRFCDVSRFVPKVFDSGFTDDYFYIAMEYIGGEDLSQAIHRGALPWQRAVAITMQICEFLEEADRFEVIPPAAEDPAGSASRRILLLHNDLKPRNIRLTEGDAIKVLDFGAAKALSLSRKVTRNDFGSTAYLSPECLESGDRDAHSDAWALGVLLYEMVRGRQPFRADDTRRLEHLIRSREAPESIAGYCPPAVEAVIAKLLAPYPADRYDSPAEIYADLSSAHAGGDTKALAEGWPRGVDEFDEAPTRRTHDEAPTRKIEAVPVPVPPPPPRRRFPQLLIRSLVIVFITLALNEGCVASRANRLAHEVALQDFSGLAELWPQYHSLADWSFMGGAGVAKLESALAAQTMVLAERVMANYRTPLPTVRENQWKAARDALARAVGVAPGDHHLRAALRYCEGHLYRINGEAAKARGEKPQAQQQFTEAVVAFRDATAFRSNWPDPFLGLARTFIYGLEDVDRGADALAQAEKNGHHPGERETTQLADGYRARGETLLRTAQTLKAMPQERDYLERAGEAFREALTRYSTVSGFGNAAISIRETQRRLDRIEERLREISKSGWWPWD